MLGFGHAFSACLFSVVSAQDDLMVVLMRNVSVLSCRVRSVQCVVYCVAHGLCLHRPRAFMSCFVLCCVAHSLCFTLAVCFHVVMFCVNTCLMSVLIVLQVSFCVSTIAF